MILIQRRKPVLIISGIVLFYALSGFFIVPALMEYKLPEIIKEETGRSAAIADVHLNPFTWEFRLKNFEIQEQSGQAFVAFDDFYLNFNALASLFNFALTFDHIRLSKPYVRLERKQSGEFNFSDLITEKEPEDEPEKDPSDEVFPLTIYKLIIADGKLRWEDKHFTDPVEEDLFPINLDLDGFTTIIDNRSDLGFSLNLGSGGSLKWSGKLSVNPIYSEGHIRLDKIKSQRLWESLLQDKVQFEIIDGENFLEADYKVSFEDNELQLEVIDGRVDINNLKIAEKGEDIEIIDIPQFAVQGLGLNLQDQHVKMAAIESNDARLKAWLNADGVLNYETLFAPQTAQHETNFKQAEKSSQEAKPKPWLVELERFTLVNYGFSFEDQSQQQPIIIKLEKTEIVLDHFSNRPGIQLPFRGTTDINENGTIKLNGHVVLEPLALKLAVDLKQVGLKPFQAYLNQFVRIDVIDGNLNVKGDVSLQQSEEGKLDLSFKGDSNIARLHTRDHLLNKDFIKWDNLDLNQINFNLQPTNLTIAEILLEKPYARVTIKKDKTLNVKDVVITQSTQTVASSSNQMVAAKPAPNKQEAAPPTYQIGKIKIVQGLSDFSDYSLILPFVVRMNSLDGTLSGISSKKNSKTGLSLNGKVFDLSPVDIQGEFSSNLDDLDIAMNFKSLPLPFVTPYMADFTGYKIEKGKMSLALNYKISDRQLIAENNLYIDQFTLGKEVENPDAVSLPLKLAIALMKDANGVIDLDLPITGSLDDPEFSVASLVLDAFINIITKIVASPFQAIASLIGSDEDLSIVKFDSGSPELTEVEINKLFNLTKALNERPRLSLEIKGAAYQEQDWPAMQQDALLDQLKQRKADQMKEEGQIELAEDIQLSDDEYKELLADLFIEKFPELGERSLFGTPKLIPEEIGNFYQVAGKKLAAIIPPDQHKLFILAATRARNIARYLVQQGGIANERIFVLDAKTDINAPETGISTELSLNVS